VRPLETSDCVGPNTKDRPEIEISKNEMLEVARVTPERMTCNAIPEGGRNGMHGGVVGNSSREEIVKGLALVSERNANVMQSAPPYA
jgi:hypothetical protein